MKKIGVLGGTFNPIHSSHLFIASRAYDLLGLDKVIFMPSKNPMYKNNSEIADEKDRCEMIRAAIDGYTYFELSDFELKREGPTYSSVTFSLLKQENPDTKYYFIIGMDSLEYFEEWNDPQTILKNCTLVVVPRVSEYKTSDKNSHVSIAKRICSRFSYEDSSGTVFVPEIMFISSPLVSISSTLIRAYLKCGMPVNGFLPKEVMDYIERKGLYSDSFFVKIKEEMKQNLTPKRYRHVLNVAELAFKLALMHGYDPVKAYTAGLLHDMAKYLNDEEIIAEAERAGIEFDEAEKALPCNLLHSKVGAFWAKEKYGIEDEDIISAIYYHTTGRPGMSLLEKIIFISDTIEPGRNMSYSPSLDVIRSTATYDLDKACAYLLQNNVPYIIKTYKDKVCRITIDTYEYYTAGTQKNMDAGRKEEV